MVGGGIGTPGVSPKNWVIQLSIVTVPICVLINIKIDITQLWDLIDTWGFCEILKSIVLLHKDDENDLDDIDEDDNDDKNDNDNNNDDNNNNKFKFLSFGTW